MKFEQALRAMRRGEVCKAPHTKKKFRIRENGAKPGTDIFQELSTTRRSCTGGDEEVAWLGSGLCGLDVVRDGWKIIRKKKKAPEPTPLPRNIFKDPRVGDEFGNADCTWRVIGVSDYEVAYKCVKIRGNPGEHLHLDTRDCFVTHQDGFATLTRVPTKEEVGSPDAT